VRLPAFKLSRADGKLAVPAQRQQRNSQCRAGLRTGGRRQELGPAPGPCPAAACGGRPRCRRPPAFQLSAAGQPCPHVSRGAAESSCASI
jgi:hypothetical protein